MVFNARHGLLPGCAVALDLISDDQSRHVSQTLQQLTKKLLRCFLIASALDENIQHVTILIHRSPQVVNSTIDLEEYFIEMPSVAWLRTFAAQSVSEGLTKLQAPFANRLISEGDASHPHDLFDIAIAEGEAEVEPNTMAYNLGGEAMVAIKEGVR